MPLDYVAYEALFNTGNDDALVERFFADDCVMLSSTGTRQGKAGLLAFLRWAHDGVREVMRPQTVLSSEDLLFAEVDMDFHASKVREDFTFGPLRPGDLVTVKFFVTYRLNPHGRIVELKSMTWPPERGVTKLPRLGSHPSQVAAYHAYAAAFSAAEFEGFARFYTDDVVLNLPSSTTNIVGRQGIVDFYRPMFERVRETLIIEKLDASDTLITVEAISRFTAIEDAPDFVIAPLTKGEWIKVPVHIAYSLRDGLISDIAVTRNGEPRHSG